jgi:agmatine/peptidylarginine deiminase
MNWLTSAAVVAMGMCLLTACKQRVDSEVKGHFEHGETESSLAPFAGKLVAVPEYRRHDVVLMSMEALRSAEIADQLLAVARSPVQKLILAVPRGVSSTPQQILKFIDDDLGTDLIQDLGADIAKISLVERTNDKGRSLWVRDYAPVTTRHKDTGESVLVEFNYLADRASDDAFPRDLAGALGMKRISLPLYLEGGNFMINDAGDCLMSDRIVKDNEVVKVPGDKILSKADIEAMLKTYLGCSRVVIFPSMPHEATRHIDIWAKFLDNDTILVSRMSDDTVQSIIPGSPFRDMAEDIQKYLAGRIPEIRALGFKVVEVPMPAPDSGESLIIRSYANSLLLSGQALVPVYSKNKIPNLGDEPYVDEMFISDYEKSVEKAYTAAGFKYIPVPADDLVQRAGTVHCSTMQLGFTGQP